mmetsp:Transcript_12110/g.28095  ORF Transcript_12110/g.28095 Transcript_12110/m.28095 type:complete len:244 (-) Transcript_12110:134-865(-)
MSYRSRFVRRARGPSRALPWQRHPAPLPPAKKTLLRLREEVAHEAVDLVGEAQVQVVLAVGQDVQARAWDVLSEPLGMLAQTDRVLGSVEDERGAFQRARLLHAHVAASLVDNGHPRVHSVAPHWLQVVAVHREVRLPHPLRPVRDVTRRLKRLNVVLRQVRVAAENDELLESLRLGRRKMDSSDRSITPAHHRVRVVAELFHQSRSIVCISLVKVDRECPPWRARLSVSAWVKGHDPERVRQ